MIMFDLNETIDHLIMANSVYWYMSCVEERGCSGLETGIRF